MKGSTLHDKYRIIYIGTKYNAKPAPKPTNESQNKRTQYI